MNFIQLGGGRVMDPATGEIFDSPPVAAAPPVAPVAPTNFTPYTLGGTLDPAITKYLQDSVAHNTANGSGYGGAGGSFDVGNGNYVLPVVQPNVTTSGNVFDGMENQYTGIAAHSSAPYTDGKLGYAYDPSGNLATSFDDAPYKRDWLEYGAMALIAAASGGAAGAAMGAGGALGGGAAGGMGGVAEAGLGAGMGAGAGAAGGAAGAGLGAGSGAFLGEGAASGIGAWDAALANAPAWTAGGGMVANGAGSNLFPGEAPYTPTPGSTPLNFTPSPSVPSDLFPQEAPWSPTPNAQPLDFTPPPAVPPAAPPGGSPQGVPPPANPYATPEGVPPPPNPYAPGSSLIPGVTNGQLLGAGSTLLGALGGSQSASGSGSGSGGTLDPRLEPYLYGTNGLLPQTQATLNAQQPLAQQQAAKLASTGSGLLGQPIAGNGFTSGAVSLQNPTTATNPYLSGQADDIARRTQELLGQNNLSIQGNSVATGGLGGSRQGVAQGLAAGKAADYLQGNLANLYGTAYNNDQNRALQKYQADQGFYSANRTQDLAGAQLGSGLLSQSQTQAFAPLTSASGIYKPYTGLNSSQGDSGTNWQGLLGGALQGASFGRQMNWW